ncbi:hypothetical protein [Sorangium sp. So ce363]|uniref:hypothetical protein n=1 Tax=Sorangium sp. So ce363 TaxID=3133304 RepID=UPI003F62285A
MNRFLRGGLAAALAVVAGVAQLGCVAQVDDETAVLQEDSAEEVGEAKGALCYARYKVRWDRAGVYVAKSQSSTKLTDKYLGQDVTGPDGFESEWGNGHYWSKVRVHTVPGHSSGWMRADALTYRGCW